jgi:hypothetical protein
MHTSSSKGKEIKIPVQGRLHVLQHSHRRIEIGICRLDVRESV